MSGEGILVLMARVPVTLDVAVVLVVSKLAMVAANDVVVTVVVSSVTSTG